MSYLLAEKGNGWKTAARSEFDIIPCANELFYRLITSAGNLRKRPGPERNN